MGKTIREAQPFPYETFPNRDVGCEGCAVYAINVEVKMGNGQLWLCRSCLERMRVTLKAAWKELMPTTKQVRPQ